ncbi:DUF6922 domain-containing protein [Candidatus Desulforudis audaxviator]|uniref:DUF6922 domain-containing protein n=1 Tax=Desulforudis audaxviator (strain MP104C) TaxID=477974 RepID=B1I6F1_DESAP|nr:hypothetical protein Daud_2112 [Candidatus Desulforudis audaxviator MP104C]
MDGRYKIPVWLYSLFWDVNPREVDLSRNSTLVIERVLNEGDQKALKWLFRTYTEDEIRQAVLHSRSLSLKTARCWQNYFNLKEEAMRCFGMYSTGPATSYSPEL